MGRENIEKLRTAPTKMLATPPNWKTIDRMWGRLRPILELGGLTLAYVVVAKLGLMMDAVDGFATFVWPASGLALAALVLRGNRGWPAVTLGAFIVNAWAGASLVVALGIAAGNTLEALAGAALLRRIPGFRPSLDRVRDALGVAFVAVTSTALSATLGVLSLTAGGAIPSSHLIETWRAWWIGDALGDLVVTPLVLVFSSAPLAGVRVARRWEGVLLAAGIGLLGLVVFARHAPALVIGHAYFFYPLLMWAALRFGQRGASLATFVCAVIALTGTVLGAGPFVQSSLQQSLLALQLFMGITAATFLVLAASILEKRRAVRDLEASRRGLETRVEEGVLALGRANERLVLMKQLEEAVNARDALISIASHELRTPLAALQLHLDLTTRALLKQPEQESVPERMRGKLGTMERQVGRLSKLVDHLLDVSRLTAGRLDLALEDVDLAAIVREVADRFHDVLDRAGCAVTVRADMSVIGSWDRVRLEQVVTNLLSNAAKYGSGQPIEISVDCDGDSARLTVRDHGRGIPAADQGRIFERFERLAGGREAPGFGLGLWIVRQLVEGMRGQIRVASDEGVGATFVVELPRCAAEARKARSDLTPTTKRQSKPRPFEARKN
jgi:signal transduction histidine kinase